MEYVFFNCNYAILYYNITSYSPRQAHFAPAVVYFYGLAGDSMHNMNFNSGFDSQAGTNVSFKYSLLCITNQSKSVSIHIESIFPIKWFHKNSALVSLKIFNI